jgi:nucleotide-binding universal stress UspA family protein
MHDMLLHIDTYAEPTLPPAIDQAVGFARVCGGRLSAVATHIDIRVPDNWLAERLLGVSRMADVEENKSLEACRASIAHFEEIARKAGVFSEAMIVRAGFDSIGDCIVRHARTRDLTLVAVSNRVGNQRSVAEDAIFGAGRPILVYDPDKGPLPTTSLERVSVLWDGSRCAARAVADARHVLAAAREIRIVTIIGEKRAVGSGAAADLIRHLGAHGLSARVEEAAFLGSIGASIDAHVTDHAPQILVMGAYGASKLKEFVLGGATEHVLGHLRIPAILSH